MMTNFNAFDYDRYIVAFSGGKDSVACFLHLIQLGIPLEKVELWHHRIDGHEGSNLMDWPVTDDYCRKFAKAFGVPIYYSWKTEGFEGELLRENRKTLPNRFEYPAEDSIVECGLVGGVRGKDSTRRLFPQVTANLSQRWCSAYLKIDVASAALNNQKRFHNKRTLFITGERAEESTARAHYAVFEPHRCDARNGVKKRWVDHWRPVHSWGEPQVWDIIERANVLPHPAYRLGWGRLSCMFCIFGSDNQWKSAHEVDPQRVQRIIQYEQEFGKTIHRKLSVIERISKGVAHCKDWDRELIALALSDTYTESIFAEEWELPIGAYGENAGPT